MRAIFIFILCAKCQNLEKHALQENQNKKQKKNIENKIWDKRRWIEQNWKLDQLVKSFILQSKQSSLKTNKETFMSELVRGM